MMATASKKYERFAARYCSDCQRPFIRVGYGRLCPNGEQDTIIEPSHYDQPRPTTEAGFSSPNPGRLTCPVGRRNLVAPS